MSEADMRGKVVRALRPLDAMAVENPALPGTPDVNYIEGWIELKWLRAWPKRPDTVVRIEHFTKQQRVWHFRRRRAGGQSWFLLQVRREWLLLDGAIAAVIVNRATKLELIQNTELYWNQGLCEPDLANMLSEPSQEPYKFTDVEIGRMR